LPYNTFLALPLVEAVQNEDRSFHATPNKAIFLIFGKPGSKPGNKPS
jgi:hypothetical protein